MTFFFSFFPLSFSNRQTDGKTNGQTDGLIDGIFIANAQHGVMSHTGFVFPYSLLRFPLLCFPFLYFPHHSDICQCLVMSSLKNEQQTRLVERRFKFIARLKRIVKPKKLEWTDIALLHDKVAPPPPPPP